MAERHKIRPKTMAYEEYYPPGTSYYYNTQIGFYTYDTKANPIQVVEGKLTFMWRRDIQPKSQNNYIYHGVEIGLNDPINSYDDYYGKTDRKNAASIISPWAAYSKDVVFLNLALKRHTAILENLLNAYKEGRLKVGTRLKFEFYDEQETLPDARRKNNKTAKRLIRVYIGDSETPEPRICAPRIAFLRERELQPMINSIYQESKTKHNGHP